MKSKKIIIGSRGSKLALIYAEKAKERILKFSKEFEIESVEIKKITTTGDLNQKDRLSEIGGKGLFLKQIEKIYEEEGFSEKEILKTVSKWEKKLRQHLHKQFYLKQKVKM